MLPPHERLGAFDDPAAGAFERRLRQVVHDELAVVHAPRGADWP